MREYRLWQPGEGVLVGISGGADSTALLVVLLALPDALRPRVVAAHFDHGLRGSASAADALFAASLAARLHVPFVGGAADPPLSRAGSAEADARQRRYAFLAAAARRHGCSCVAVGHHRDDQVETVLLRLARGAGAAGLGAMAPSRPLADDGARALHLVRPLFLASRTDVLSYLGAAGLSWREDDSNADPVHARNRVRAHVLPALDAAFGPGARERIWRAAQNLRADAHALSVLAEDAARRRMHGPCLDLGAGWADLPDAVRAAELRAWWALGGAGPPPRADVLRRMDRLREGATLEVGGGVRVQREGRWLVRLPPPVHAPEAQLRAGGELSVPGTVLAAGVGEVRAWVVPWPEPAVRRLWAASDVAVGDAAGITLPLRLRVPLPGERLAVLGAQGRRRVREMLAQRGVPPGRRALPWVLEDADGRPLWVVGARQAAWFRIEAGTGLALVLRWRPEPA